MATEEEEENRRYRWPQGIERGREEKVARKLFRFWAPPPLFRSPHKQPAGKTCGTRDEIGLRGGEGGKRKSCLSFSYVRRPTVTCQEHKGGKGGPGNGGKSFSLSAPPPPCSAGKKKQCSCRGGGRGERKKKAAAGI